MTLEKLSTKAWCDQILSYSFSLLGTNVRFLVCRTQENFKLFGVLIGYSTYYILLAQLTRSAKVSKSNPNKSSFTEPGNLKFIYTIFLTKTRQTIATPLQKKVHIWPNMSQPFYLYIDHYSSHLVQNDSFFFTKRRLYIDNDSWAAP